MCKVKLEFSDYTKDFFSAKKWLPHNVWQLCKTPIICAHLGQNVVFWLVHDGVKLRISVSILFFLHIYLALIIFYTIIKPKWFHKMSGQLSHRVNTLSAPNTPWEPPPCSYGPFSPGSFCSFNPRCFCPGGFFWLFKSLSECHLLSKTFPSYWSKKHLPSQVTIMSPYLVLSVLLILKRVYLPHL